MGIPMANTSTFAVKGAEKQPLKTFTEKAYLDYSMYVILDRALPRISNGLKPVQRHLDANPIEQGPQRRPLPALRSGSQR